jgi:hypothetical protein
MYKHILIRVIEVCSFLPTDDPQSLEAACVWDHLTVEVCDERD